MANVSDYTHLIEYDGEYLIKTMRLIYSKMLPIVFQLVSSFGRPLPILKYIFKDSKYCILIQAWLRSRGSNWKYVRFREKQILQIDLSLTEVYSWSQGENDYHRQLFNRWYIICLDLPRSLTLVNEHAPTVIFKLISIGNKHNIFVNLHQQKGWLNATHTCGSYVN